MGADRLSPLGIDVTKMRDDLAKLGKGQIPEWETGPSPGTPGCCSSTNRSRDSTWRRNSGSST